MGIDTTKVPSTGSKIGIFSPFKFLSKSHSKAAAVVSLIILITFNPAMTLANFVVTFGNR